MHEKSLLGSRGNAVIAALALAFLYVPIVTLVGTVASGGGGGLLPRVKVTSRSAVPCAEEVGVTAVIVWANADDATNRSARKPTVRERTDGVCFIMVCVLFMMCFLFAVIFVFTVMRALYLNAD